MNEYEYLYSAGIRQIDAHAALKNPIWMQMCFMIL